MSFKFFTEMLIVFCCFEALNIKILKFVTSLNVLRLDLYILVSLGYFLTKKILCIEAVFTLLTFPKECQRNPKVKPKERQEMQRSAAERRRNAAGTPQSAKGMTLTFRRSASSFLLF